MVGFACSTEKPSALPNTNLGDFSTFQHLSIFLTSGFQRLLVVGLYQDENRKQHLLFSLNSPSSCLTCPYSPTLYIYILGDLNIHLDNIDFSDTSTISHLLDSFFEQHVSGPTHKIGHTIDATITSTNTLIQDLTILTPQIILRSAFSLIY